MSTPRSRRILRAGGPRSLRWIVASVMVGVAMASLSTVAVVNLVVTDALLTEQVTEELVALQASRSQAIVDGLDRGRESVAMLAADLAVTEALVAFAQAIDELEAQAPALTDAEGDQLRELYATVLADEALVASVAAAGVEIPTLDELVPVDPAARYLQYHYLVPHGFDPARRIAVEDPGDGSVYSAVHAERHGFLRNLAAGAGLQDLMLVSIRDDRIVYSVAKGANLAADAVQSIHGAGGLAAVLSEQLPRTPIGEGVLVDLRPYLAAGGEPVLFIAAAVRDGRELVGALVAQVPVDPLNRLMTGGGQWTQMGLGETGETYVVGRDLLLRSDSRGWIEDPEQHLADLRSRGLGDIADRVAASGATVLVEPVDIAAVRAALGAGSFVGQSDGALGDQVIAVASPLGVADLDWVVVAQLGLAEATGESANQRRNLLVVALVLIPLVGVVGWWLARRLTRPVGPLVAAAESVASGNRMLTLQDMSRDEFGHLARELSRCSEELAREDAELAEQHRAVDEILRALLPERLIDAVRAGTAELGDLVDTATVVAVTVEGVPEVAEGPWALEQSAQVAAAVEGCAAECGLERVWASSDHHVFLAGLGRADQGSADALRFVHRMRVVLAELSAQFDIDLTTHAGLAAGSVATGIIGGEHISFGVWGEPAARALALDAVAQPGQVLVHPSVTAQISSGILVAGHSLTVDLGGTRETVLELDSAPIP
jgi:class 3 adenylate cyclase